PGQSPGRTMTDEQLMNDVRRGDRTAFELLFERHRPAMWRFFRRRMTDAGRAEELTQDVFVALLQNASRYEARAAFRSYLFGIAYNILRADRRKAGRSQTEPTDEGLTAGDVDLDAALWVRAALATLDANTREIVMLREYEQLTYQEIAALLCMPLNTVRSRLFRARMDLRTALSARVEEAGRRGSLTAVAAQAGGHESTREPEKKVGHDGR
ncbi:MAG: RNA polymerase sigma factor, partial [Vicinamibacterales bacterium]